MGDAQHENRRVLIVWGSNTSLSEDPYNAVAMNFDFDGGFNGNIPLSWTQITAGGSKSDPAGAEIGDGEAARRRDRARCHGPRHRAGLRTGGPQGDRHRFP